MPAEIEIEREGYKKAVEYPEGGRELQGRMVFGRYLHAVEISAFLHGKNETVHLRTAEKNPPSREAATGPAPVGPRWAT